jgi:hypothetical protein
MGIIFVDTNILFRRKKAASRIQSRNCLILSQNIGMFFWISLRSLRSSDTDDQNAITGETVLECQIMFAGIFDLEPITNM